MLPLTPLQQGLLFHASTTHGDDNDVYTVQLAFTVTGPLDTHRLRDAVRTATVNPARVIHLEGRMRGLVTGERGDVVAFRLKAGALKIESVWFEGVRAA